MTQSQFMVDMCRYSSSIIHDNYCMALDSSSSGVDQTQAASGEEDDRSVKSDLHFAISQGGLHGINITPKSQLSKSHSGVWLKHQSVAT